MSFIRHPVFISLALILCVLIFYTANTGRVFGKFINKFFPCEQNLSNSYPCFGHYDVTIMILSFFIGVFLLGLLFLDLMKWFK